MNVNFFKKFKILRIFVLVVVFELASWHLFTIIGMPATNLDKEAGMVLSETQEEKEPDNEISRPKLEYTAYNFRDPFENFLKKTELGTQEIKADEIIRPPLLSVEGVVWGGRVPQAIVNGQVVKKGDIISEAEITEIGKEGVKVIYRKRVFTFSAPAFNDRENNTINQGGS